MPVCIAGGDTAGGSDAGFVAAFRSRVRNEGDRQATVGDRSPQPGGKPIELDGRRRNSAGNVCQQVMDARVQRSVADALGQRRAQEPLAAALTGTKVNCSSFLRKVPRATDSVAGLSITANTQSVVFTAYQRLEP